MFNNLLRRFFTLGEVELNPGVGGFKITVDTIGTRSTEVVKAAFGAENTLTLVDAANPLPTTDAAAEAALLSIAAEDFATQTTLAAILTKLLASIAVTGTFWQATQPVSGTVAVTGAGDASAANQTSQITQETAINTVLGLVADAIVAAGATGTISAKLRRATQGLEDLKSLIVLAAGTNAIGKLAANSGVTIGAVELAAAQTLATVTTVGTITNNVNTVEVAPTTILHGQTSVTTAGTRVVLAASTACKSVTIKAFSTNTGFIYVGSSTVSSSNGFRLSAGDTVSLDIANLNTVNIDSSVNSESVSYLGVN